MKEVRIGCEVQLRYMSINEGVAERYTRLKRLVRSNLSAAS